MTDPEDFLPRFSGKSVFINGYEIRDVGREFVWIRRPGGESMQIRYERVYKWLEFMFEVEI